MWSIFVGYCGRCDIVDILLEMQRILRPEGAVIIRDGFDVLMKVKSITNQMRWNGTMYSEADDSFDHGTILIVDNSLVKSPK